MAIIDWIISYQILMRMCQKEFLYAFDISVNYVSNEYYGKYYESSSKTQELSYDML